MRENMELYFYYVDGQYIDFLKKYETKEIIP
jgi:hypothetical protein